MLVHVLVSSVGRSATLIEDYITGPILGYYIGLLLQHEKLGAMAEFLAEIDSFFCRSGKVGRRLEHRVVEHETLGGERVDAVHMSLRAVGEKVGRQV